MTPIPRTASRGMICGSFILSSSFEGLRPLRWYTGLGELDTSSWLFQEEFKKGRIFQECLIAVTYITWFQYISVRRATQQSIQAGFSVVFEDVSWIGDL